MGDIVFKRKYRWTLAGDLPGGKLKETFVKISSRPIIGLPEIDFVKGSTFEAKNDTAGVLTATIYGYDSNDTEIGTAIQSALDKDKLGNFKLALYDGCGSLMETWELNDAYISALNWMELDHSSCETTDVELTIQYGSIKFIAAKYEPSTNLHSGMGMGLGGMGMGLGRMGMGTLSNNATCPKCNHSFPHIVFK